MKEELINKGLTVNIKPIPNGRKMGIAHYEDAKGILNLAEAPKGKMIGF